jgi:hypothetical protein
LEILCQLDKSQNNLLVLPQNKRTRITVAVPGNQIPKTFHLTQPNTKAVMAARAGLRARAPTSETNQATNKQEPPPWASAPPASTT